MEDYMSKLLAVAEFLNAIDGSDASFVYDIAKPLVTNDCDIEKVAACEIYDDDDMCPYYALWLHACGYKMTQVLLEHFERDSSWIADHGTLTLHVLIALGCDEFIPLVIKNSIMADTEYAHIDKLVKRRALVLSVQIGTPDDKESPAHKKTKIGKKP